MNYRITGTDIPELQYLVGAVITRLAKWESTMWSVKLDHGKYSGWRSINPQKFTFNFGDDDEI